MQLVCTLNRASQNKIDSKDADVLRSSGGTQRANKEISIEEYIRPPSPLKISSLDALLTKFREPQFPCVPESLAAAIHSLGSPEANGGCRLARLDLKLKLQPGRELLTGGLPTHFWRHSPPSPMYTQRWRGAS